MLYFYILNGGMENTLIYTRKKDTYDFILSKRIFKFLFIIKGGDAHNNLVALLLFVVTLFLICKDTLFISICYIVYAIRKTSAR